MIKGNAAHQKLTSDEDQTTLLGRENLSLIAMPIESRCSFNERSLLFAKRTYLRE